ncbi:HNH endonuclease signature motif containing protein [Flexivirga oryzae]|uniref:HNH nuclease domain-containing protein n=1 Tax=Flexivirga oryzae TaxID=1794944 RepID=A0A839N3P4_9MICO|nr:HNH endonuclease signature motif containing protein [Flexivirga oryzae]MBB2890684.1 hypothetical protein [Flexivirga oryzae]
MTTKQPRGQGDSTTMAIDSPLRIPGQPAPVEADTTCWDGPDPARRPEPGLGPRLAEQVRAVADALDQLPRVFDQLGQGQLTDLVSVLLGVQERAGQVATLATANACERGVVDASDAATTTGWVRARAQAAGTSIEPSAASTVSVVAEACRDRRNHVIAAAVRDGSCTLATARTALRQTAKVAEVLPAAAREDIQSWFLQLDPALGSRGVTELTRRIIANYAADKLSAEDAHLEKVESLTWRTLPTGMIRLIADLCPANAAILKQAINALSAPHPAHTKDTSTTETTGETTTSQESNPTGATGATGAAGDREPGPTHDADTTTGDLQDTTGDAGDSTGHAGAAFGLHPDVQHDDCDGDVDGAATTATSTGGTSNGATSTGAVPERVRDERTPGKRRVDALMDLVAAGAKTVCGDGMGIGAGATVLVTMDLHRLLTDLDGAITIGGEILDAGTARRLACDADLIPMVLGTKSQPLDVGRRERLATTGIRAAVVHRDMGCTFPTCDRPPGFCEIHHILPWWAGGDTALDNSAMLCRRHHQIVHRHGYTATITSDGVHWDLTEGAMPGWAADKVA